MSKAKSGQKKSSSQPKRVQQKKIKNGDFIYIDYIGIIKETNDVFDTTIKEEAEKAGISHEEVYEPMLVIVGEKWVVDGLDEALANRTEKEYFEVEIPPEKGFGRRDSKKIVTTTLRKLRRGGLKGDIRPGMVIQVNNVPAIVKAVVSGRVMLDFNPPLAGKNLIYKIWIRKILKSLDEKVNALIKKHSREIAESSKINIREGVVEILLNTLTIENPRIGSAKKKIAEDIIKYIPDVKGIRFIEEMFREKKIRESEESPPPQD